MARIRREEPHGPFTRWDLDGGAASACPNRWQLPAEPVVVCEPPKNDSTSDTAGLRAIKLLWRQHLHGQVAEVTSLCSAGLVAAGQRWAEEKWGVLRVRGGKHR